MSRPRLALATLFALLLFPACGGADRPEGAVEDWLLSLNQGEAGEPGKFASEDLTNLILPGWDRCDPGGLDVIEVGKGTRMDGEALVPYHIEYDEDLERRCRPRDRGRGPLQGIAVLEERPAGWRIIDLDDAVRLGRLCRARGEGDCETFLRVPSEGGRRVGSASVGAWLVAVAVTAVLTLGVAVLMRRTPEPAFVPSDFASRRDSPGE